MVVPTQISQQSSSSSSTHRYDVFLSFRGEDTRLTFTDHLLKALEQDTIDVFFDDHEIRIGDFLKPKLEDAIRSSRASIIVLSENYATSTWCLDELALIMEQPNHIVYPIFYHVKPSDIRKQTKSFGDAMEGHQMRMEEESDAEKRSQLAEKIERWKKALTRVADMKGVEADDRRETKLIEEIVEEIYSRLGLHKRSEIPKLTGRESLVRTITTSLKDGSGQRTQFFTIWGMAGIGKTYLAENIFKSHYLDFESSCFLEDIERTCKLGKGLLDLQKQLFKDIGARASGDIRDVKAGTLKIEKLLKSTRSILVLDGIDTIDQLDVLIGTKGLHPGSKVIITSKNATLTEKCRLFKTQVPPKHTKHELRGLNEEESLQLLSLHAFGRNEPDESDEHKAMKVVEYCQGHPLALKVLGSSVRSEEATWDDILESLGNEINPDIEKVLRISFDTLQSEKDKELFKHIACLFVREDRKYTEDILKACGGVCKPSGVTTLINRCLLSVSSSDKLMMHQLLQDMGRDLVRQEYPRKPWKRSILWHHEECLDVLQNNQGTTHIQGLALDMRTSENETWKERSGTDFETLALREMRKLRLLQLNYVRLSGSYKNFPQGLRWLCMHGFPLSYVPSDLPMENMVALDMSNSKLQQLWEKKPKQLSSLKFLNLSSCHKLVRVGYFSELTHLERLKLAGCTSLVEVCESIGNCYELQVLDLSECSKLKELPRSIGKLKNLTQLILDGCSNLAELPVEMKDMESLRDVTANNINMNSHMVLRSSRSFVSSLPYFLLRLSLKNCNLDNESFHVDFSSLSMLKELSLDENPIDSMPDGVRSLSQLEILTFTNCVNLKTVFCAPILVKYLGIENCNSLEKITFHEDKSALPEFIYFNSIKVTEIQYKFKRQALSEIDEEVLRSLGWINIEYLKHCRFSMADCHGYYYYTETIPMQMLYEHGIFSTYLQGQEIPTWFTHRSSDSLFTLQSSPENGKIQGINVCIVHTISSIAEVGPSRIEIKNLTKNSSWTYEPTIYFVPDDDAFKNGGEVVVAWLSHWMFGENEFRDGDEISIHFSVKHRYLLEGGFYLCYDSEGLDHANVREYGMSLVYDDDNNGGVGGGGNQKGDPLRDYNSWKHIIGKDLSTFEVSSSHYLLTPSTNDEDQPVHPYAQLR